LRIYPTWFPMKPSIATKFQLSTVTFYFHSLHVSAPTGHLQVRYTTDAHKDYSYHNGVKIKSESWQLKLCCDWRLHRKPSCTSICLTSLTLCTFNIWEK
jgi:hypothetical protein